MKPVKHFSGKRFITGKKKSSASAGLFMCKNIGARPLHGLCVFNIIFLYKKGAVKKVPKKKGCDLAKKQDSSLFLWYN